jgi:hypothetical protein
MKAHQCIEAGFLGAVLATLYWQGLKLAGIPFMGGIYSLGATALALAWFYSVVRFSIRDADSWFFGGRKYHVYEIGHFAWPALFGAIAALALIAAMKDYRWVLGWGFPILGIMTYGAYKNDLRQHRA